MKKYICRILVFFLLFIVIDLIVGFVGDKMVKLSKGGDTSLHAYINDEMQEDVLFFGSSRCMHHYVPRIVDDSLNTKSFNCGTDGMGIPFMYARYKLITSRIKPRVIFYDVYPSFDIYDLEQFPNSRNLRWLKPYYHRSNIKQIFNDIDPMSTFKYILNMYRFNGYILDLIKDCLKPSTDHEKGYCPLSGEISPSYVLTEDCSYSGEAVDSLKLKYWRKLFRVTKEDGVKLVLLFSPLWGQSTDEAFAPIKELASEYSIPIINHYADTVFNNNRALFSEPWHLNGKGAEYYTSYIIPELKHYIDY